MDLLGSYKICVIYFIDYGADWKPFRWPGSHEISHFLHLDEKLQFYSQAEFFWNLVVGTYTKLQRLLQVMIYVHLNAWW